MKVYITYDRYENDEFYSIFNISLDKEESIKHCKEVDLVEFLTIGPDDCHSFQLQEVEMMEEEYEKLLELYNNETIDEYDRKLINFMKPIYDSDSPRLIETDGCSDNVDVVHYYGQKNGLNTKDDDTFYSVQDGLFDDEELYQKVIRDYINDTY